MIYETVPRVKIFSKKKRAARMCYAVGLHSRAAIDGEVVWSSGYGGGEVVMVVEKNG